MDYARAHHHGGLLNSARLASALEISNQSITRYIDLLLVRRLQPYHVNVEKCLIKAPKVNIRDSGLLHALLHIADHNQLAGHPIVDVSWESFVIENLISAAPARTVPGFYRTTGGAEIDLILELPSDERSAIEIKHHSLKPKKDFYQACIDLQPTRAFLVHAGEDRYPINEQVEVISLKELTNLLVQKNS